MLEKKGTTNLAAADPVSTSVCSHSKKRRVEPLPLRQSRSWTGIGYLGSVSRFRRRTRSTRVPIGMARGFLHLRLRGSRQRMLLAANDAKENARQKNQTGALHKEFNLIR